MFSLVGCDRHKLTSIFFFCHWNMMTKKMKKVVDIHTSVW